MGDFMTSVLLADLDDCTAIGQEIELPGSGAMEIALDFQPYQEENALDALAVALSGRLDALSDSPLAGDIVWGLRTLADHFRVDRVSFIELPIHQSPGRVLYNYRRTGSKLGKKQACQSLPWICAELKRGNAKIPTQVDDLPQEASADRAVFKADRIGSCIAVPLKRNGDTVFGLICEATGRCPGWSVETLNRVALAGDIIANAVQRVRANETIIELRGRLVDAQERERRRIARELHDDVSQRMAHLCLDLVRLKTQCEVGDIDVSEVAEELANRTRNLSSDISRICRDLYPSRLEHMDLVPSLLGLCRDFSSRYDLDVQFIDGLCETKVPGRTTFTLYRIAQEALHNVVKHSGSTDAIVEIRDHDDGIEMSVTDNGAGFDPKGVRAAGGVGLNSIRDRLQLIDGHLHIDPGPGHVGTRLRAWAPAIESAH